MSNIEIRTAYMKAGVKQWQVAKAMGVSETHFSKKMRNEIPAKEKERILAVIESLTREAI